MNPDSVVAAARAFLGTPYRHQAATIGAGCDCLGLLRGVWRQLYGSEAGPVPPYRADLRDPLHAGALRAAAERLLLERPGRWRPGRWCCSAWAASLNPSIAAFSFRRPASSMPRSGWAWWRPI